MTGLARVAVKENNLGLASEYMDDAVQMMSADSDIYIRRASVRRMLGNNTGAVEDLLMAISIDSNTRAFQELIDIANIDYPAVISGLSTSISYAPQQGMLYYIRGFIAQAHDHYASALVDYRKLIDQQMYEYPGLYNSIAQCELALCQYSKALDDVEFAISTDGGKNGEFFVTKARIFHALSKNDEALKALEDASLRDYNSAAINDVKAIVYFSAGNFAESNEIYSTLMIEQPESMRNYIYRAWVMEDGLRQSENALALYNRVVDITTEAALDAKLSSVGGNVAESIPALSAIQSYRGFALLFSGDREGALNWAADLQRDYRDSDGYLNYIVACLYAQASAQESLTQAEKSSLTARSLTALENAFKLGYANLYEITVADVGRVSLAPIRKNINFSDLISRYSYLFE